MPPRTPVAAGRGPAGDQRAHLALLAELREVDHWRRLVAARIDLAVASVAALDEPVVPALPAAGSIGAAVPSGLRELLGLTPPGVARGEADVLLRLRGALRDLDAYASALRAALAEPGDADQNREPAPVVVLAERRRGRNGPDGVA